MHVLKVEPCKEPVEIDIEAGLESLQAQVGGYIEAVYPYEDPVALVCNEEGKLNGSSLNRALYSEEGKLVDILAGDFLVVGLTEDSFGSLTPEQMQRYEQKFHQPETFVRMGKSIMALPIPDKEVQRREAARKEQPEQKAGKVIRFPKEPAL